MFVSRHQFVPIVCACVSAAIVSGAHAAVLLVPVDFPSIQSAIDAADAGDQVVVLPGTYHEQLNLRGKPITVMGMGPAQTIVDGGGADAWIVTIDSGEGPDTIIEGLTVTGAISATTSGDFFIPAQGGGVLVQGASPTLRNVVIRDNRNRGGGAGMATYDASPTLESVKFMGNVATAGQGGGLLAWFGDGMTLRAVTFTGNDADDGGGAALRSGTYVLDDVTWSENTADQFAAGLYASHATLDIQRSRFTNNGEVYFSDGGAFQTRPLGGGAMYLTAVDGRIANTLIADNNGAFGAGAYIAGGSVDLTIANVLLRDNFGGVGAALYFNAASPTIVNSTAIKNGAQAVSGIFTTFNASPVIVNSILSANGSPLGTEIAGNGVVQLSYSIVNEVQVFAADLGPGVLQLDPLLDASGRPVPGSPAIDAGDNSALPAGLATDLAGNPRRADDPSTPDTGVGTPPLVDLGAYEFIHDSSPARRTWSGGSGAGGSTPGSQSAATQLPR